MFGYTGCWWFLVCILLWWAVASFLLFLTWNKVIVLVANLKAVKFWHALLVVATISVFCLPQYAKRGHRGWHHGKGKYSKQYKCPGGAQWEKCPFAEEKKQWLEERKEKVGE